MYYQMLIEDKENNIRYLSDLVVTDKDLSKNVLRSYAQQEHFSRFPDDRFIDKEFQDEIFKKIDIVGLVELKNIYKY